MDFIFAEYFCTLLFPILNLMFFYFTSGDIVAAVGSSQSGSEASAEQKY